MTKYIYGVLSKERGHIDVSRAEHGAKMIATKEGYDTVTRRRSGSYQVQVVAVKTGTRWVNRA